MTASSINAAPQGYALHNKAPDAAKTMKAAQDFESMTINQMLQPMFQTDDDSQNMFSGGAGEKQFRPMMVEQIAKQMENNGGIGLTDAINRQMLAMQEQK
ncbi:chemotactic signal-response protein CheL [Gluconobacter frateurii M-2]|jgi:Rod binding domain-containing protein|uniref:rod-binding protein n=1 Tax=Gluconobacter thailandicus TaxID=257438 RepID=UPI0005E0548A|nr:rod-binding protein [Gluconobacter thailandicus]KXV32338.1 chemotaxis protein chel [Gluconobacter thailandicus]GAN90501.1 chemotactic signal-response protein CheL [Gluconobacter frateurii M-2]